MFEDRLNSEERELEVSGDCPNFAESAEQNGTVPFAAAFAGDTVLDTLNPEERELEIALRSLRPAPARIEVVRAAPKRAGTNRRQRMWPIEAAAAAVLLGLCTWLALRPGEQRSGSDHPIAMGERDRGIASQISLEPPTLLVYRRALARSPAELESLLDQQSRAGEGSTNVSITLTAWKADLHSSLGDM